MSLMNQVQPTIEQSKKSVFTCTTCHVAFPTSEGQRNHYRTDWHKYNLKRKVAELTPINAEQFAEKILASKAKGREEEERMGLIYECAVCRKSYYSENAFNNHMQSKKHREMEEQAENPDKIVEPTPSSLTSPDKKENNMLRSNRKIALTDSEHECLFCSETSNAFDTNIKHMETIHGFFLPDAEYLQDAKGLIHYLSTKVNSSICLYCNGRGKEWKSVDAVCAHMIDTGHCKMAYDESEDPEELLKYYDFGDLDQDNATSATVNDDSNELVLKNGLRVSHRRFLKSNKHHGRREDHTEDHKEEQDDVSVASLPRRERRQRLAITDGSVSQQQKEHMAQGIRSFSAKQNFEQHVSIKNNVNTLLRLRNQVPI